MMKEIIKTAIYSLIGYFLYRKYLKKHITDIHYDENKDIEIETKKPISFNEANLDSLPNEIKVHLNCSISFSYYRQPVISNNGITFEYESIKEWLRKNEYCPCTKNKLSIQQLIYNENIAKSILFFSEYQKHFKLKLDN